MFPEGIDTVEAAQAHIDRPPIEIWRAAGRDRVNAIKRNKEYAPIDFDGDVFDASRDSQQKMIAAGSFMSGLFVNWITADNRPVRMTAADFRALVSKIMARTDAAYHAALTAKTEIDAAQTQAEIDAIVAEYEAA